MLCDPDPRFLTCEEEVTPVELPTLPQEGSSEARCVLSTRDALHLPRLSLQPLPTVVCGGWYDAREGAARHQVSAAKPRRRPPPP